MCKRKYYEGIILLFFLFVIVDVQAQQNGYVPVKNIQDFKARLKSSSAATNTLVADFQQEKTLTALTEKINSSGKFWYKKSNNVRMEYEKPFLYRMIIQGDKIYIRDSQKNYSVNAGSNKLFQQINRIMIDCVQGTILENKDFTSKVLENTKFYRLEMTPVAKGIKDFYSSIVVDLQKSDLTIHTLTMHEPGGDRTVMNFKNVQINAAVEASVFNP